MWHIWPPEIRPQPPLAVYLVIPAPDFCTSQDAPSILIPLHLYICRNKGVKPLGKDQTRIIYLQSTFLVACPDSGYHDSGTFSPGQMLNKHNLWLHIICEDTSLPHLFLEQGTNDLITSQLQMKSRLLISLIRSLCLIVFPNLSYPFS